MQILEEQPQLAKLHALVGRVRNYPITAAHVVNLAVRTHASQDVVEFYKAFPPDEIFSNRDDLLTRSEQVELFEEQLEDEPEEFFRSSQD